jgi:hypothetical protein
MLFYFAARKTADPDLGPRTEKNPDRPDRDLAGSRPDDLAPGPHKESHRGGLGPADLAENRPGDPDPIPVARSHPDDPVPGPAAKSQGAILPATGIICRMYI